MKKIILTILFLIGATVQAQALMITHPEAQDLTVNENAIFFTGKIERHEKVYINNVLMVPSKSRAFCHSVPLITGINNFAVQKIDWRGNIETIKYTITRANDIQTKYQNEFIQIPNAYYKTTRNNVVLRNTPIDAGMNRIGYLPQNTILVIDGTQNEFSRVYLTKNKCGWVMTKDLIKLPPQTKKIINEESQEEETIEVFEYNPKSIISTEQKKDESTKTYKITLSENTPYSAIADTNKLSLSIYNLDITT